MTTAMHDSATHDPPAGLVGGLAVRLVVGLIVGLTVGGMVGETGGLIDSHGPLCVWQVVPPVNITEPHPGVFVVDFGVQHGNLRHHSWAAFSRNLQRYATPPRALWGCASLGEQASAPDADACLQSDAVPVRFGAPLQTNLAGVCKLSNIKLARGAHVTLRHGEILQHAGLPDLGKNVDPTMPYVLWPCCDRAVTVL